MKHPRRRYSTVSLDNEQVATFPGDGRRFTVKTVGIVFELKSSNNTGLRDGGKLSFAKSSVDREYTIE